ncbi:MAG: ferredoxin [Candidatus Bathyarchaeota archaeon]|nr:ferredoxin [Candidatus Bathyarchaeota archaeon]
MSSVKRAAYSVGIDKALCKGCLICVYVCNKRGSTVLKESGEMTALGGSLPAVEGDCIGCRWCERLCPDFAINVEEGAEC